MPMRTVGKQVLRTFLASVMIQIDAHDHAWALPAAHKYIAAVRGYFHSQMHIMRTLRGLLINVAQEIPVTVTRDTAIHFIKPHRAVRKTNHYDFAVRCYVQRRSYAFC